MIKIYQYYIAKIIIMAIALVLLMLTGLQIFILFFQESSSLGQGNYAFTSALAFVLLQTPEQVYLFSPIACLLGSLLGLGLLASNSELIVMRAAGISILQIAKAVLLAALVLLLPITILGETVIPKAVHKAENLKAFALSGETASRSHQGLWFREKHSYIHVNQVSLGGRLQGISQYQFNAKQQLKMARYASHAYYNHEKRVWYLQNVSSSFFYPDKITTKHAATILWAITLNPSVLAVATVTPAEMSLSKLYAYITEQHQNFSLAGIYELAFWQRLVQPFSSCVMMLLAIPFVFGSLRSTTQGLRFLLGSSVGFGFYMLNQFFGPMSIVYQFPPLLAAVLPTLLSAVLGIYLICRR